MQNQQDQQELLSRLSPFTKFVKVETKKGVPKWRLVEEILSSDTILLTREGEPYQMASRPGRKKKEGGDEKKKTTKKPKAPKSASSTPTPGVPSPSEQELKLAKLYRKKKKYLSDSRFLKTVRENPESNVVLKHIMEGIAGEIESMSFDRDLAEQEGEATSMISNRIIQGYKAISEAFLRRKEQISDSELDLASPAFKNLLGFIVETIKDCMEIAEIPREEIKLVLTKTGARMNTEDWVMSARKRMRGE